MSKQERLKEYRNMNGPKGESSSEANLKYWADRASENSYHGKNPMPKSKMIGKSDKNHVGEGDYMPKVRRGTS